MKKEFHAHPLMILSLMKPFMFILIFPFIKGLLQYITDREVTNVLTLELICFFTIAVIAGLRCKAFRLICCNESVIIKTGVIFKTKSVINLSKLSSVQTTQNPLEALFRTVTYKINTEAGVIGKSDFEFKLSTKDSKEVSLRLYGGKSPTAVRFSVIKVAVMAATTSSAVSGMIVGVPVLNRAGKLLGVALDQMLLDEINNVSGRIETYFPPIVNTISLLFLLAYAVSFLYSLFKYINFRLFLEEDKLEVKSGFFVRSRTYFKKSSVNCVLIEQTPLMRFFKRYVMKVAVGGYGNKGSETAIIVPSGGRNEIKNCFSAYFPFLAPQGKSLYAMRNRITQNRFLFFPALYFLLTAGASITLSLIFTDFTRLILFLTAITGAVIIYYAYLSLFEFRFGKLKMGKNIYAKSVKWFKTCELYCPKENVGQIKIIRNLADVPLKTCKVAVYIRSESADRITVHCLNYEETKKSILNCYGIEV